VLGYRARKQRADEPRVLNQPLRPRPRAERQQPGRDLRQEREMIIRLACALERDTRQRAGIGRKRRREHGIALDHAGIAIGGLLAHAGAIDQRDAQAPLGKVQRDRGADNAGTEHDGVRACDGVSKYRKAKQRLYGSPPLKALSRLPTPAGVFPQCIG
jgi:hypothetical protein